MNSCVYLLISHLFTHVSALYTRQAGTSVNTTSGTARGHAARWPPGNDLVEFLGIPYARSPTGPLRFSAPVAYASSDRAFDAADYSVDCLQFSGDTVGLGGLLPATPPPLRAYSVGMGGGTDAAPHVYGEDCLSVNVWTKHGPGGDAKKAVMVWMYGGAFASGTSNAPFYNGTCLCLVGRRGWEVLLTSLHPGGRLAQDEDIVFVSMNYRVGFWGFPHAPELEDQNLGLLDQRLAVEWVRDNIAGFGGDPTRITIFGESAGGSSVDLYSFAWTKDPIVNGFIAQSGTAITSLSGGPLTSFDDWYEVSNYTGCGGEQAGPAATLACMRNASVDAILAALGKQSPYTEGVGIMRYGPVADGKVVFEDVKDRARRGDHVRRPMLNGNNDKELGLVVGGLKAYLGPWLQSLVTGPVTNAAVGLGSDAAFGCSAALTSALRTRNEVPNWRYRFMPVYDNTALAPQSGTYHSMDVPFVMGTNSLRQNSSQDTPEEAALQTYMVHAWAEFAKDPDQGLSRMGWPTYDPNGKAVCKPRESLDARDFSS